MATKKAGKKAVRGKPAVKKAVSVRTAARKRGVPAAKPDAAVAALAASVKTLSARVRELEDDNEIRELLARYGFLADQGLDEAFVNLFTEDGEMNLVVSRGYEGVARWKGHERLLAFISGAEMSPDIQPRPRDLKREGRRMHVQGNNLRVKVSGDEATAESYSIVLTKTTDGMHVEAGSNRWLLRRVDGQWKIRERMRRAMGLPSYHEPYLTKN